MSSDTKFDHIDLAERQKVLNECVEGEAWLREKRHQQDPLPKYVNPVLLSADIRKNADALDRICRPIMMKHKPSKPTTPEPTSPSPSQGAENTDSCPNENDEYEVPPTTRDQWKQKSQTRHQVLSKLVDPSAFLMKETCFINLFSVGEHGNFMSGHCFKTLVCLLAILF